MVDFTAWVAVAVCDGIQAACGVRPRIKWTNDIVLGGRKLCGILTELGLEGESNALDYLITGIGVNVNQRPEDFLPEVRPIAVSLAQELGRPVRRAELAVEIIRALDRMYAGFPDNKAEYLARYRADCLTPGNQVQLITPVSREGGLCPGDRRPVPAGGGVSGRPAGRPVRRRGVRPGNVWLCVRPEECGTGDKMDKNTWKFMYFPSNLPFCADFPCKIDKKDPNIIE